MNLSQHFTKTSTLVTHWNIFKISSTLSNGSFLKPFEPTNFIFVLNYESLTLSIYVVQQFQTCATSLI